MDLKLDTAYWKNRYETNDVGWDIGSVSSPLKKYFDQLTNKTIPILIPGGGNSYEAEYLFINGFTNITVIDLAEEPIINTTKRLPKFPKSNLIIGDFFLHQGSYDLIVEQTFFCAIHPRLRNEYVKKMHQLLKPNGKLVGVLFDDKLNTEHPPFGGAKEEYRNLFSPYFKLNVFEKCYNSIQPRAERELFINFQKE